MTTRRFLGAAAVAALATATTIAIATIAITTSAGAAETADEVRLHLGTDSTQFTFGSTVQTIATGRNSCAITSAQPLIELESSGARSAPGLANLGIGVKASPSSGNGSPCGQIDASESLTLRPGDLLAGRRFAQVRLDLEMAGDAVVVLTLANATDSETYRLQTGTSIAPDQAIADTVPPYLVSSGPGSDFIDACAAPNSSGPNSGGNDNCQWTVTPSFSFDRITLTTEHGTVSLEGGGDFGGDPGFDTVFSLAGSNPVANPDTAEVNQNRSDLAEEHSVLIPVLANDVDADGDPLTISSISTATNGTTAIEGTAVRYTPDDEWVGSDTFTYRAFDGHAVSNEATVTVSVLRVMCSEDTVTDSDGDVTGTFMRLSDELSCKRYTLDADAGTSSVLFQPVAVDGEPDVTYRGVISLGAKPAPGASGALNLLLEYDPELDDTYKPVQWCSDPVFDDSGAVTTATLPIGETWCIASETTRADGTSEVVTTWQVFGQDDPRFQ